MHLGETRCGRVTKAKVNRESWFDLKVVQTEQLGPFQAGVRDGLIGRAPLLDITKQEISQAGSRGRRSAILRRVVPTEGEITGLEVSPWSGIALAHQHLNTKMEDVLRFDQGNYVRGVIQILDIDRVCTGIKPRTTLSAAVDVYLRKNVRLGILQTQSGSGVVSNVLRNEPDALLGIGHAEFVHNRRTDCPG